MQLIDTHCHLDEAAFEPDLDEVVDRAAAAGLIAILTIGTTAESSRRAIEIAQKHQLVHAVVGIQPNYTAEARPGDWEEVEQLAGEAKVVALGETGLDRYWDFAPVDLQADYFDRHIELARRVNKPFIVHCRDADADVVSQLQRHAGEGPLSGVMHSFCGSSDTARECLAMGMHISFAGMLTYKKNDELRATAATIPHDRLLIETDAPYLAPVPKRGKRNEPALVAHTNAVLAEALGVSPEETARLTTANARELFGT